MSARLPGTVSDADILAAASDDDVHHDDEVRPALPPTPPRQPPPAHGRSNAVTAAAAAAAAAPPSPPSPAAATTSGVAGAAGWASARKKVSGFVGIRSNQRGQLGRHPSMGRLRNAAPDHIVSAIEGDDDSFGTYSGLEASVQQTARSLNDAMPARRKRCSFGYMQLIFSHMSRWTGFWVTGMFLILTVAMLIALLGDPMVKDDIGYDVNDPVGAFVSITSLVYALIFASAYTEGQSRFDEIRRSLVQEANGVHTAMLLVRTLDAENVVHKMRTLLLFGHYIQMLSEDITKDGYLVGAGSGDGRSNIETLYAAMPSLDAIASDGDGDALDRSVIARIIDMINNVSEARATRETAIHNEHHWLTYAFLAEMGIATVFGVLMLQFGSTLTNTLLPSMIILALFSSMVFLADLEHPFDGFVEVDVSIFDRIRRSISDVLAELSVDEPVTLWVGHVPLDLLGPPEDDNEHGRQVLSKIFSRFGLVEAVAVRRKERPPSWDAGSRAIGSWALVTFASGVDGASADSAVDAVLAWGSGEDGGTVPYQGADGKERLAELLVKKAKLDLQHDGAAIGAAAGVIADSALRAATFKERNVSRDLRGGGGDGDAGGGDGPTAGQTRSTEATQMPGTKSGSLFRSDSLGAGATEKLFEDSALARLESAKRHHVAKQQRRVEAE